MATAATRFLTKIGAAPQLEQLQQHQAAFRHHDFWEAHDVSQMSPEEFATREKKQAVWYMYAFRQDRGRVYDTIQQAVYEYFDAWQDSKIERGTRSWREIVVEVLEYAKNLGADEVVDKLERYAAGNAEKLVDYLDEKFERGQR